MRRIFGEHKFSENIFLGTVCRTGVYSSTRSNCFHRNQNCGTFAAVFLGQAVINRQNPEKMICRRESNLSKNIFLIAVRQTVPKISALKLCLYFPKIGAKIFFSWEKGYLNFSIRGSLSIIEAQYPSNVIAR